MQGALAACAGNTPTILCQNRGLVHGRSIREGEGCSVVTCGFIFCYFSGVYIPHSSLFLSPLRYMLDVVL